MIETMLARNQNLRHPESDAIDASNSIIDELRLELQESRKLASPPDYDPALYSAPFVPAPYHESTKHNLKLEDIVPHTANKLRILKLQRELENRERVQNKQKVQQPKQQTRSTLMPCHKSRSPMRRPTPPPYTMKSGKGSAAQPQPQAQQHGSHGLARHVFVDPPPRPAFSNSSRVGGSPPKATVAMPVVSTKRSPPLKAKAKAKAKVAVPVVSTRRPGRPPARHRRLVGGGGKKKKGGGVESAGWGVTPRGSDPGDPCHT